MSYKNIHPFQPGLRTIYVNHTTGGDGYAGTISEPCATIQQAVNRFKPLDRGAQNWALNDDRTILVQDPGGDSIFDEEIVIPPHAGDGALIIRAEYQVEFSGLVESGSPFSTIAGFEVRQRLSFTTSPMTASTLGDGYFVVPQTNTLGNPFEFGWEILPIVDNATGTCDVVAYDPGSYTAFTHLAAVAVDIVKPQVIWRPGLTDASGDYPVPCIRNMGGSLIVEGFRFQNSTAGQSNVVLMNTGPSGDTWFGGRVYIRGCVVENNGSGTGFRGVVHGDSCALSGVLLQGRNGITMSSSDLIGVNIRQALSAGFTPANGLYGVANAYLYGVDTELSASDSKIFNIHMSSNIMIAIDLRGGGLHFWQGAAQIDAMSCEDSAKTCIVLSTDSTAFILSASRAVGSSGNTDYGVRMFGYNAVLEGYSPPSLSGSLGDLKVGDNPITSWGVGDYIDMTKSCKAYNV